MPKLKSKQKVADGRVDKILPQDIFNELNKCVIGQTEAKRAVSIAIANRSRRMRIKSDELRKSIIPNNILMTGPTGVGKTEIARSVALITNAPFIKVEMTRFTEVGYAGRDVESIIKDLLHVTIIKKREELRKRHLQGAKNVAEREILKLLPEDKSSLDDLRAGKYDDVSIDMPVSNDSGSSLFSGVSNLDFGSGNFAGHQIGIIPIIELISGGSDDNKTSSRKKTKKVKVKDAIEQLIEKEISKFINDDDIIKDSISDVEQKGIVFLDEIDKLISNRDASTKGEVSREGVQRDLLPLIEGMTVQTRHGMIKTDHILFIAAGAFHENKVSDLMPELQGRLPIKVALKALTVQDFEDILTKVKNNILDQHCIMLESDDIKVNFAKDGVRAIAEQAEKLNFAEDNIGARRLHSIVETVLEEISFSGDSKKKHAIDKKYVDKAISNSQLNKININKFTI